MTVFMTDHHIGSNLVIFASS